jgi:mannose-1-phosphate guanylyltransferase
MVPVLNKPFLEYTIRHLVSCGINEIILAQGHLAQSIKDYFGNGQDYGVSLSYVVEKKPLGTAGAVKNAVPPTGGTLLVLNGDIFTDLNLEDMFKQHQRRKAVISIAVTSAEDPSSYGLVETDTTGRVRHFLEKPSPEQVTTNMVNAGSYILESEVLTHIPENTFFSFEQQLFPNLLAEGIAIYTHSYSDYWIDIGDPKKYFQLNRDLLCGISHQFELDAEVVIGTGSRLASTANIHGPVIIGRGTIIDQGACVKGPVVIGDNCYIGEDTTIEQSITWQDVYIGHDASLIRSIAANSCILDTGCVIQDCVLGHNVTIPQSHILRPGSHLMADSIID